jgi:hypothetical protein
MKMNGKREYNQSQYSYYQIFNLLIETPFVGRVDRVSKPQEVELYICDAQGNILVVVSDLKLSTGFAKVKEAHDYYPFCMEMAGRVFKGDYKFGFQGQLEEDDIWGEGAASFFKYRLSDNRIGRFFAVDPLATSNG